MRGIERMIEEDRYCIDVLTQISAVTTALESLAFVVLDDHVSHCVAGALASGDPAAAEEKSKELLDAVHRFSRRFAQERNRLAAIPLARKQTPLWGARSAHLFGV